jgi:Tfp pilus assembly protein PilV
MTTQHPSTPFATRRARRGISVIEVLTSILVATIGVAGVMVIIPFAVGQAEQGFDQEAATAFGKNFADEFELRGFHQPAYWTAATAAPAKIANGFVIDPIGTTATPATDAFPYVSSLTAADAPTTIAIERTNLLMAPSTPTSYTLARTLFSWRNDLVSGFPNATNTAAAGYPTPELAPAEMYFDVSGTDLLRRQYEGEISCVVFCLPDFVGANSSGDPFIRSWRSHTVVYRRRQLPTVDLPRPYDRVFDVTNTVPERLLYGGGELILTNNTFSASNAQSSQHSAIRRGDWMALTNGTAIQQLNFYRVLDATEEPVASGNWRVTLQGPDFDLLPAPGTTTFAIHLPDVWAVIERTFQLTN